MEIVIQVLLTTLMRVRGTDMDSETKTLFELAHKLQLLAHKYGYNVFKDALAQACFNASQNTECFEDKRLTQQYRYLANTLADASINEPVFDKNKIED